MKAIIPQPPNGKSWYRVVSALTTSNVSLSCSPRIIANVLSNVLCSLLITGRYKPPIACRFCSWWSGGDPGDLQHSAFFQYFTACEAFELKEILRRRRRRMSFRFFHRLSLFLDDGLVNDKNMRWIGRVVVDKRTPRVLVGEDVFFVASLSVLWGCVRSGSFTLRAKAGDFVKKVVGHLECHVQKQMVKHVLHQSSNQSIIYWL